MDRRTLVIIGLSIALLASILYSRLKSLVRSFALDEREVKLLASESGNMILAGLYAYHERYGCWPEDLDELVPEFLPAPPNPRWFFYGAGENLQPCLSGKTGWENYINYLLDDPPRGWQCDGKPLDVPAPQTQPAPRRASTPATLPASRLSTNPVP